MTPEIKMSEKYALSIYEAAAYFNIGEKRLRKLIADDPNATWILWNGSHVYIKRKLFETKLDAANAI